jgi:hypothetical protein
MNKTSLIVQFDFYRLIKDREKKDGMAMKVKAEITTCKYCI